LIWINWVGLAAAPAAICATRIGASIGPFHPSGMPAHGPPQAPRPLL